MSKLKNYLLITAGLVILGGAVQFVMPLQADPLAKDVNITNTPLPVVVENGNADETMVITIVEDLTQGGVIEFDAVDASGFRFVSFHGRTDINTNFNFRFSTQAGKFSDDIPKNRAAFCQINSGVGADCFNFQGQNEESFRVTGPFLLVQLEDAQNTTVQVFLSR